MKRNWLLITMIGLTGMVLPAWAAEQTLTFAVEKMDCPVCPITVKKAMENVDGVAAVTVDFDTKTATVTFDDDVTSYETVGEASTNAGYPAKLIRTGS